MCFSVLRTLSHCYIVLVRIVVIVIVRNYKCKSYKSLGRVLTCSVSVAIFDLGSIQGNFSGGKW